MNLLFRCVLQGYGYGGTAKKSNNRRFDPYGEKYSTGDVIGCLLDMDGRTIHFTYVAGACKAGDVLPADMLLCGTPARTG